MEVAQTTCVVKDGTGNLQESLVNDAPIDSSVWNGNRSHEQLEDLDYWNPMSDDYESEAFNSYKEPSVTDFVNAFPGNSSQTSGPSTKSSLKNDQSDVRLFVGRIPQQMTQEGLQNLFHQVGKLSFCNLIPQHNKDTKIGFVGYETIREAELAIQKFDGLDLGQGYRLKVALALSKQKPALRDLEETMSDGASSKIQDHIDYCATSRKSECLEDGMSSCVISNSNPTSTGRPCSFCGQLGLKWCSVCKTPYCSRDCQRNDWPKHKRICLQQPLAERKPTTPLEAFRTSTETVPSFTATSGDLMQATTPAVLSVPPGDPVTLAEDVSASTAPGNEQTKAVSDKKDPEDLEIGEAFDIHNAEMFAQMMGFDLSPVKVVEDSKDNDSSDASISPSLTVRSMYQEAMPEVSVSQRKGPALHTSSNTTKPANTPISEHSMELESVRSSAVNIASKEDSMRQHPTCAKGDKRFFIEKLGMEGVPTEDFFEVVVTDVENPSCFWAQLCTPDALQRQNQLKKLLQVSYSDSVFENYVPTSGEVCVAQFSLDSCWYRVKVDIINNTGTLRVTYIDFGNHEDIALDKVRRITEDLICYPRQALKLSLYGITSSSSSGQWSSETNTFFKSKVLGMRCKVHVCEHHNEVLFVKLLDPKEGNSDKTINESLMKAGFSEIKMLEPSSLQTPKLVNPTMNSENHDEQTRFNNSETRQLNSANSKQGQQNICERQRGNTNQDGSSCHSGKNARSPGYASLQKEHGNPPGNPTEQQKRNEPFEAIINAIVSPWEFYAMKTDKQLLDKLETLMQDLNKHITGNSCSPQYPAPLLAPGDICAARFSVDNVWYRALILDHVSGGFRVRYMDFGNSEVVQDGDICPLPQQFQSFPPLSLTCSLAGVRKPRGQNWSPEAVQQFKSLVADKPFLCRIVYTQRGANIVELLDPGQGREQTVAKSLISSGLADAFIPIGGNKHQSDEKGGPSSTTLQKLGVDATPEAKSPLHGDTRRSSFNPQYPGFPNRNERGISPRNDCSNAFKGEGIESVVFEPAIQATALPQDVKFDILVTEVVSPGLFYCQLGTVESLQNGAKLTEEMNSHYNAVSYPPFVPRENNLCAAHFAESGDWCRAFIKGICSDGSVYVHYVDYGNTEMVPPTRLRPLLQQFSFETLPFSAMRCSLANIVSPDALGWSDEAMAFAKAHLLLFSRYSVRLAGRRRGKLFLDVTTEENGGSVSQAMVNQGLARAMVRADHKQNLNVRNFRLDRQGSLQVSDKQTASSRGWSKRNSASPIESLVYQPAIQSAMLPQDKSLFDVIVTEVATSGLFFIQIADHDTAQNLKKLSAMLNEFYDSSQPTSFHPQPNQFCAAHFTETGDWCRALIKEISSDGLVEVHYVDYGNTEKLPMSSIQPLMDTFTTSPFFALPCSLANITQPESPGWPDEAMKFIKENVPLFQRLAVKVVGKRRGMLFVDFMIPKDQPCYLSQLLLNEGFAQGSTRSNREIQKELSQPQEETLSVNSPPCSSLLGDLESNVFEPAVQSVAILDCFDAMITNIASPDLLFIQILTHEKVRSLKQLSDDMNAHYEGASYPPFHPQTGLTCAALFSGSGDWCRAFIDGMTSDGSVHVHYLDYGNSEVLSSSQVRPLAKDFQQLPPMALKCSLSAIQPAHSSGWSDTACESLLSQLPLFSHVKIKVVRKEYGSLVIDAISPNSPSQESLSQFLVSQGIAQWQDLPSPPREHTEILGERRCSDKHADLPKESSSEAEVIQCNFAVSQEGCFDRRLPMSVPKEDQFDVVITEVIHPGEIWAQVTYAESYNSLSLLMKQINQHCASATVPTFLPNPGQECCALFSLDNTWYRARVLECPKPGEAVVQYVDFGNSELITPDKIRPMKDEFFELPAQAIKLSLANVRPAYQVWNHEAVEWLKHILNQKLTAKVVHRLPQHLVVLLEDWTAQEGPCNINEELVRMRFAVKC